MADRTMRVLRDAEDTLANESEACSRYLQAQQAQLRPPTNYENLLGDAIERAFASGITDLAGLVESLNRQGMTTRRGESWTEHNYGTEMAALSGAGDGAGGGSGSGAGGSAGSGEGCGASGGVGRGTGPGQRHPARLN